MKLLQYLFLIAFLVLFFACKSSSQTEKEASGIKNDTILEEEFIDEVELECKRFTRDKIKEKIKNKIDNEKPLLVHIFVPLCDNDNQGIVPVSKSLGDGMNLRTNLYWGAGYGIKTHFKRKKSWKLELALNEVDTNILERVVFTKQYNSKTKVILIADAYRGDRMEQCMRDYFKYLAGMKEDTIRLPKDTFALESNVDLLVFNGHNGLMDVGMEYIDNEDGVYKDAAVISCVSANYFMNRLACLKAYPLVTTQQLLPPEAYIVEGIIDAWATQKSEKEIRLAAGNAMYKVFKRNQKGMQGIFKTGWWKEVDD